MAKPQALGLYAKNVRQVFMDFANDEECINQLNPNALIALGETIGLLTRLIERVAGSTTKGDASS